MAIRQTLLLVAVSPGWFLLWVFGLIPFYEVALGLTGLFIGWAVWRGWQQLTAPLAA